jgi:hypothetical protein
MPAISSKTCGTATVFMVCASAMPDIGRRRTLHFVARTGACGGDQHTPRCNHRLIPARAAGPQHKAIGDRDTGCGRPAPSGAGADALR